MIVAPAERFNNGILTNSDIAQKSCELADSSSEIELFFDTICFVFGSSRCFFISVVAPLQKEHLAPAPTKQVLISLTVQNIGWAEYSYR